MVVYASASGACTPLVPSGVRAREEIGPGECVTTGLRHEKQAARAANEKGLASSSTILVVWMAANDHQPRVSPWLHRGSFNSRVLPAKCIDLSPKPYPLAYPLPILVRAPTD